MVNSAIFKTGLELCLQNANQWLEESNRLYEQKNYGHYCALLFQGAEALAQAYVCWEVTSGVIDPKSRRFRDAFKHHRVKIDALFSFLLVYDMKEKGEYTFPHKVELNRKEARRQLSELINSSGDFYRGFIAKRNNGMYVDWNEDLSKFSSPLDITKEFADQILLVVRVLHHSVYSIIDADQEEIDQFKIHLHQNMSRIGNLEDN
jgi:AbiV family abortive infection protein